MNNITKFVVGITMLLVTHVAYSDTEVADIKNLLSQEKFDQMGLSKLSDRELSELYQWIKSGEFEESLAEKTTHRYRSSCSKPECAQSG